MVVTSSARPTQRPSPLGNIAVLVLPPVVQYCSRDERDATAAEVGAGGLLRYVGTGEPVHTLSAEDSDMLVGF